MQNRPSHSVALRTIDSRGGGKRSGKIPLSRCAISQSYELDPFTCDWKQNNLERRVRRRGRWFSSTANDETTILTDDDVKRKPQCGDSFLLDWTIEFFGEKGGLKFCSPPFLPLRINSRVSENAQSAISPFWPRKSSRFLLWTPRIWYRVEPAQDLPNIGPNFSEWEEKETNRIMV